MFGMNDRKYGVKLKFVKEVVSSFNFTEVPGAPKYFVGLLNIRGKILNVIDLKSRIKKGDSKIEPNKNAVIVIEMNDHDVGVLVEEVFRVESIEQDQIESVQLKNSDNKNSFVTDLIKKSNIIILDIRKVIDLDKLIQLEEEKSA